jgi:hypothetical protein
VQRGAHPSGATTLDIAPTVLTALGIPLARDLPGKSLPVGAVEKANQHADVENFDERDVTVGPSWRAIGPA